MEIALPVMMVAGTATKAYGSLMAGQERSAAARFEQDQLNIAAQQNRTAALQMEARRTEELTSQLETIQALRAGRNTGAFSPTGRAILSSISEDVERDIQIEKSNLLQKADLSTRAAVMAGRKAKTSLLAGQFGAVEAGADLFTKGYSMLKSGRA